MPAYLWKVAANSAVSSLPTIFKILSWVSAEGTGTSSFPSSDIGSDIAYVHKMRRDYYCLSRCQTSQSEILRNSVLLRGLVVLISTVFRIRRNAIAPNSRVGPLVTRSPVGEKTPVLRLPAETALFPPGRTTGNTGPPQNARKAARSTNCTELPNVPAVARQDFL